MSSWMTSLKKESDDNKKAIEDTSTICSQKHEETSNLVKGWIEERKKEEQHIKTTQEESTKMILGGISSNRELYMRTYEKLDNKIGGVIDKQTELALYQKEANGKVGILTERVANLQKAHDDRIGKFERKTNGSSGDC
jgi:hypothetical protein